MWGCWARNQFDKIAIEPGDTEIWHAVERLPEVAHLVVAVAEKHDNGKDDVLTFVERGENLVADDGRGRGATDMPVDPDEG